MLGSKASSPGVPGPMERKSGQMRFVTTCVWYIYILHRAAIHLSRPAHTFDFQPGKSGIGEVSSSGRNLPSKTAKQFTINADPSDSHRIESHVNCKYKKKKLNTYFIKIPSAAQEYGQWKSECGMGRREEGERREMRSGWREESVHCPLVLYQHVLISSNSLALFSSPALLLLFCTVVDRLRAHFFVIPRYLFFYLSNDFLFYFLFLEQL